MADKVVGTSADKNQGDVYRSETKTPSIEMLPVKDQYSPKFLIGPTPLRDPEPPPAVGSETAREADGDNPPQIPCSRTGYSQNAPGVGDGNANLTTPRNTSSAKVTSYLGGR